MAHESAAELVGRASDNVQSAGRKAGLLRKFGEAQSRQRSPRRRLENYRVSGGECGRDFPRRKEQRKIPGNDGGDNPYGLAERVMQEGAANRNGFAMNFCGPTRVVAKNFRDHGHIDLAGLENRLAIVESFEGTELFVVLVNQVADFPENASAVRRAHLCPPTGFKGAARGLYGYISVARVSIGEVRQNLAGCRINRCKSFTRGRVYPLAIDEQTARLWLDFCRSGHRALLSFELRLPLFDVCLDAFFGIFAGEKQLLQFAFDAESLAKRNFRSSDNRTLDASDGARGFVGRAELPRVGHDVIPERFAFVDVMDEAKFESLLEAKRAACSHQFHGARAANHAQQTLCAASTGQDAKIDFRQSNLAALFFGDANVASQCDFETASDSVAIERGDYKLRRLLEARKSFV